MIHVAFNIDENYYFQCAVVMMSVLHNTKEPVTFHIVGVDKHPIFDFARCKFYPKPDTSFLQDNTTEWITNSAVYRLFFAGIIKQPKVIYLDCDVIVRGDISELWEYEPMEIAGVLDPIQRYHCYINSGVMVMNLKNIRKTNYIERIERANKIAKRELLDQDIINLAFSVETLPICWNVQAKRIDFYNLEEEPKILHFVGKYKPCKYEVPFVEEWRKYERLFDSWQKSVYQ